MTLQEFIDAQNETGTGIHIGVIMPDSLGDASWSVIRALGDVVSEHFNASREMPCSVSSTMGASHVKFMVGDQLVNLYLTVPGGCPI